MRVIDQMLAMFRRKPAIIFSERVPIQPISELENARLERDGVWITIELCIAKDVDWYTIKYSIPPEVTKRELANTLANASHAMHMECNKEQEKEKAS